MIKDLPLLAAAAVSICPETPVIFSQLGLLEGFNDAKILGNRCEFVTSVFLEKLLTS